MKYVQARSFIARLSSMTPGKEGILDSVEWESGANARKNNWLTLSSEWSVAHQQRFWFGYYEGRDPGYVIRTVRLEDGDDDFSPWDLSRNGYVGYYVTSRNPVRWRIWNHGQVFGLPLAGRCEQITIAAVGSVPLGIRKQPRFEEQYIQAGAAIKLILCLDIDHTDVPEFDQSGGLDAYRRR